MTADESLSGLLRRALLYTTRLERALAASERKRGEADNEHCDEVFALRQRISELEEELARVKGARAA